MKTTLRLCLVATPLLWAMPFANTRADNHQHQGRTGLQPSSNAHCDAHFSFDDTLADSSQNGYDGEMFEANGALTSPQYTEGKFGRALRLDGSSGMRTIIDLHHEVCPQLTIAAWIRVDRKAADSVIQLFSTGAGNTPGMRVSGAYLTLNGTDNGIGNPNAVRSDSWLFVAGTYDYNSGEYLLYAGRRPPTPGRLSGVRGKTLNGFWIGTVNDDWGLFADGVAVDELRISGQVLTAQELAELMTTPTQSPAQEIEMQVAEHQIDASNTVMGEGARMETEVPLDDVGPDYLEGTWCSHPAPDAPDPMTAIRTLYLRQAPAGSSLEIEPRWAPGTRIAGIHWNWEPCCHGNDNRLQLNFGGEHSQQIAGGMTVTAATAHRFHADSGETSTIMVRGECSASETFEPESLRAEYFGRGTWCAVESTIPGEQAEQHYQLTPNGVLRGPDIKDGQWIWQPQANRLLLSSEGISTSRSLRAVTATSFQWGDSPHRKFVVGRCD